MNFKDKFSGIGTILKKTFKGWNEDDPFRQSSIIAYYSIFSLPALLVLIINITGFFFSKEAISGEITRQFKGSLGTETAYQIGDIVEKAGEHKGGLLPSVIAIVTIIFGATGVFVQLQKTLNQIWDVKEKPNAGFLKMLKNRLFSFGLILSIGFLMLSSLVLSSVLAATSHWLEGILPDAVAYLFYALEFVLSLGIITVLFALMFKFLPDVHLRWTNVWVGALLTSILFMVGKYGLSLYFGKAEPGSIYGAAGSIILLLLWVSYSSMILFFGAEFTKQYAVYHGIKIEPTPQAERIDHLDEETKRRVSEGSTESFHNQSNSSLTVSRINNNSHSQGSNKSDGSKGKVHPSDVLKDEEIIEEVANYVEIKDRNLKKFNGKKFKNRKELQDEISKLELKLQNEKDDIKDNFALSNIFSFMIPKKFKKTHSDVKMDLDAYLRMLASQQISSSKKEPSIMDKIRKLIHLGENH
jgi:membrane protein